ncbi:hypothetical protein [Pseudomonas congelans]|nr:hypothetical protein [Pseudomonas congelans]QVX12506.1 hypothetical protein DBV21_22855 [Pseudomonas congelans]QVX17478.1 hypothetical protein DB356_23725 [Pseudomonas congelans]
MPSPISSNASLPINPALQRGLADAQARTAQTGQAPANQRAAKPGNGFARVQGQMVPMTSLNESGFSSAFPTRANSTIAQRGRLGINPQQAQRLLSHREQLAAEARQAMDHLVSSELNNFPQAKQHVDHLSQQHYNRVPSHFKNEISEALDDYQGSHGDNVLMNVAAMGFPDIHTYLKSRDDAFEDEAEVDEFMTAFGHHYSAFTGMEDEQEELEDLKSRVDDRLKDPTRQLVQYLHNAPRLPDGVPLIKGVTGGDNPITTQVDGRKTLGFALQGCALNFNGFLSTSSKYAAAVDFAGKMPSTVLGSPEYVIDLTKNDEKNEILRRHALRELHAGNIDTGSMLFLFKTKNSAGVSVNATQQAANPNGGEHRLSSEDEILLAPGHFFVPEQVIVNKDGVAYMGSLSYGR